MIKYALRCERGHEFESWFKNSAAYDSQRKRGLIACPGCNSAKVEKAIMAPRLARAESTDAEPRPAAETAVDARPFASRADAVCAAGKRKGRDHVAAGT